MNKETIEEAASRFACGWGENDDEKSFLAGAKWQADRMYTEEDIIDFAKWLSNLSFNIQHFDEKGLKPFSELLPLWKGQFKKK